MKKIDAHIHYRLGNNRISPLVQQSGHDDTGSYLREAFAQENIVHAIVMSNLNLSADPVEQNYPDFLSYCAGIGQDSLSPEKHEQSVAMAEQHLLRPSCVGLKIYAGYSHYNLDDPLYYPFYELARRYKKPVAVHMGATAHARALLRYCHPMQMDQVAVSFPDVSFVMCHFGNPFLMDAAAVVEKNANVSVDLSGLIAGSFDVLAYIRKLSGYVEQLKTWIAYVEDYSKFMFGTDFPLTGFGEYLKLFEYIIPEEHWESFYFENAKRIYGLPDSL